MIDVNEREKQKTIDVMESVRQTCETLELVIKKAEDLELAAGDDAVVAFLLDEGYTYDEIDELDPSEILFQWVERNSLEVCINYRRSLSLNDDSPPHPVSVDLLLGFGGPNVMLTVSVVNPDEPAFLAVTWWGDRATTLIRMPGLQSYLEELVECVE